MKWILKLKHWQLFIALMTIMTIFGLLSYINLNYESPLIQILKAVFGILGVVFIFGWIMTIGLILNKSQENPFKFNRFLLITFTIFCILGYAQLHLENFDALMSSIPPVIHLTVLPLLTFIGLIYTLRTVSKSIKSLEKGEKASFKDYILDAILLFAMPIGLWFIQPRLNKIYNQL